MKSFSAQRPEISWSLMHPVKPDLRYLEQVIAAAARYEVDSFEVCGEVHSSRGGLEGAIHFEDYPAAAARIDHAAIAANAALLRDVVALAHRSGRPIYYWHREVMVPRAVVETVPGLLDENGEFDLLGAAYHALIRAKLREFFTHVPDMDGLVLTVTESDYSVIHNSNPERYPPTEVIQKVIATFAGELQRRGKRFILRSFGSIAQDYIDILAGAEAASAEFPFEIETKITPYDFSPFLAFNAFLAHAGRATLSAEHDSLGEFLGAGYLPAPDPARVIESVAFARARGVERHVIRVDRIGHATFQSTQAINLLAYQRAIREPAITAGELWREWSQAHWPRCAERMSALMQRGIEVVKRTHFIDSHLIFHAFPIDPDLKWIKAGGILALWQPGRSLARHQGMWGINTERSAPPRERIVAEKEEAIRMANEALEELRGLASQLSVEEFALAELAWRNASVAAQAIGHFCRGITAYFEDMEAGALHPARLIAAIEAATPFFAASGLPPVDIAAETPREHPLNPEHAYGSHEVAEDSVIGAYVRPIRRILALLLPEFHGECAERQRWKQRANVADFILCGSITDDWRVHRYMHAGHARLINGRPARAAGNRVFPNGFLECELALPAAAGARWLLVEGDPQASTGFGLTIDGGAQIVARYDQRGCYLAPLPAAGAGASESAPAPVSTTRSNVVTIRIQKHGAETPWIFAVAILTNPAGFK